MAGSCRDTGEGWEVGMELVKFRQRKAVRFKAKQTGEEISNRDIYIYIFSSLITVFLQELGKGIL